MQTKGWQIFVTGRVQGVGFRFFTQQQATKLHLNGSVRNLADGRVEIIVSGEQRPLQQFTQWLEQGGPRSAKIEHLEYLTWQGDMPHGFHLRY